MTQTATGTTRTKRTLDLNQQEENERNAFAKKAKPSNPQHRSLLYRLPRELRNLIFTFALNKCVPSNLLDSSHDDASDTEPALLKICHRTRDEALPIFYQSNDWIVKTRRVGGESGRLDPVSKRFMTYQCIPRWLDAAPEEKVRLIRNIVFVGSRGSYVDINGKWRDGERAAFRVKKLSSKIGYCVEEVDMEGKSPKQEHDDAFCSIQLVDLLRARMRINIRSSQAGWFWTKNSIHDLAVLL